MAYAWPWPKGSVTSQEFGTRPGGVNPAGGHTGIDVPLPVGTALRAPADGTVVWADWCRTPYGTDNPWLLTEGGGIVLGIDFGPGLPLVFMAHLSRTDLNKGDRVKQGDIVAWSGNTGKWTTGPHVHLEVLLDGYWLRSSTYGRSNPRVLDWFYWEDRVVLSPAGNTAADMLREVTTEGANVRVAPWSNAPKAAGYEDGLALGAKLAVVGYVKGEPVTPGNDAWYKTKSGYFVWANAAGDNIAGLPYLGEEAPPAPPAALAQTK